MRKRGIVLAVLVVAVLVAANAGRWLVIDQPQKSDTILVLAGETDFRPAKGLELLNKGYASKLVLDVPGRERVYQWRMPELAERWRQSLPQAQRISICTTYGLSTKQEAQEAARCLEQAGGQDVLLVTAEFHTRRALSTFRREAPAFRFSVAAAHDSTVFGVPWWKHREWAKATFYEWMRLMWWGAVDRWR